MTQDQEKDRSEMMLSSINRILGEEGEVEDALRNVLADVAELHCPEASGFEGPETFSDCGKCIVCLARTIETGPGSTQKD